MKLKPLLEKKEAIATSSNTNMTLHYNPDFTEVGEDGKPEFSFEISVSSTGGKEFFRTVADKDEEKKLADGVKLELRRAMRKMDARIQEILEKYNMEAR